MRRLAARFLLAALLAFVPGLALADDSPARSVAVEARPLTDFGGVGIGGRAGELIYRGGLQLASIQPGFGGISGLAFLDAGERFVMVSDVGQFVSGRLVYGPEGVVRAMADVEIAPIRNSGGAVLPTAFSRDAEAIEVIRREGTPVAVRVGFEHLARLADFALEDGRPGGAATEVAIPDWLTAVRTNESIESVCIAPPASPVAGSTLIITEGHSRQPGTFAATLLGVADRGDLHLVDAGRGFNPTDCAFLPDGDLLVLERALRFFSFYVQIRRIPAEQVVAGEVMDGPVILSAGGAEVDNFEGIAVHETPDGEVVVTLISDNNFRSLQRTLLLQFAVP